MKTILLGVVGLVALGVAAPAVAADLSPRTYTKAPAMMAAVYDWSGFYVGLNGGGGWSHNCWTNTTTIPSVSEGCHDASGGMVGGQIGYRWQSANFVFGLEGQGDWADLKGSNASLAFGTAVTNQTKLDGIGLLTGQVGYAWNNVLWYVKGGAAVTHSTFSGIATVSGAVLDQADSTRWGGAIGTGFEVGFAPSWTVGVEYNHLFMGTQTENLSSLGVITRTDSVKQDVDMATVRVNYRWGGPVVAKY